VECLLRAGCWSPLGLAVVLAGCGGDWGNVALSAADTSAIASLQARYVDTWLADDTVGVLATLDTDAVLLPPGRRPVEGHSAIRAYWWPDDGSHTRITAFTWQVTEVVGSGSMAVARGLSTVGWTYTKAGASSEQTVRNISLSVLRRDRRGEWRIARQMWGPALP
jgi:uncharacterized protein (TIGR02246 family)